MSDLPTMDDLRAALEECHASLVRYREMAMVGKRSGHALGCQEGYWVMRGGGPAPHSARCQAEHAAIAHAERVLAAVSPRQEALL